jgi:hypothetical protein
MLHYSTCRFVCNISHRTDSAYLIHHLHFVLYKPPDTVRGRKEVVVNKARGAGQAAGLGRISGF